MKSLALQLDTKIFLICCLLLTISGCMNKPNYASVDDYPTYSGSDLGLTYTEKHSLFKLWSPAAEKVKVNLYSSGNSNDKIETYQMTRDKNGVWSVSIKGDLNGKYYTYQVRQNGAWLQEKPDLYSTAVGVNGQRTMILDLNSTDPKGWTEDQRPKLASFTDIVIYESQIRDLTISSNSGVENKGKYIGLTESGTINSFGQSTGLDHIKDLGITHIHLLPTFDHRSIDESRLEEPQYNWGYDPLNYNVPEGSFSSDPFNGEVRIREFKKMVQTLHGNGIRVILDVVYNHTGQTEDSNFNQLVPNYYYRKNEDDTFSDASACGNETASERYMMRKYIVESVVYWATEYHLDGFRFDLMGIHDLETMNAVTQALHKIDSTIFVYGEGWTAGQSPLPTNQQALKANTPQLESVAAFSDDLRDGLKGSVFNHEEGGFVSQVPGLKESIKFGIVGSTQHPQIDYQKVNYSNSFWANSPAQCINYVSCHDNHTLFDKLRIPKPDADESEIKKMHKLAQTIVLTSQGVPFLHAGTELLRSKNGIENSFESPDEINEIDWDRKHTYQDVVQYYQELIELRKNHPAFRMKTTSDIQKNLEFLDYDGSNFLAYQIGDNANGDEWNKILVLLNGSDLNKTIKLPQGTWTLIADGNQIKNSGIAQRSSTITIPAMTAFVLKQD